jgi:hypothetical protein
LGKRNQQHYETKNCNEQKKITAKVPKSEFSAESAWPTQPVPTLPKPYARQSNELSNEDVNPYSQNIDQLKQTLKYIDKNWYVKVYV